MVKINIKADFRNHSYLAVKLTKAKRIKKMLPKPLPWVDGTLNTAYLEVAEALIWGLNHAVIALSGGLCEHLFRLCLYEKCIGCHKGDKIHDELWETFNKKDLTHLICDAKKKKGIIPKEDHNWWFNFSTGIRNPYIHFRVYDILGEDTETIINALTGEEFEIPIQPYQGKWAMSKKYKVEKMALSFFSDLTIKISKIIDIMNWSGKEAPIGEDSYLYEQYNKFFADDFNYLPEFINIPDDYWVDY
jgi:hypothetical protein